MAISTDAVKWLSQRTINNAGTGTWTGAADIGLVGYEMTLLVSRAEATMTPALVSETRARLPVGHR